MRCHYECIGGWLPVSDAYVAAEVMKLPGTLTTEVARREKVKIRDSVSPCPSCRPEQYDLWRGGHFAPDHTCDDCKARQGRRRSRVAGANR